MRNIYLCISDEHSVFLIDYYIQMHSYFLDYCACPPLQKLLVFQTVMEENAAFALQGIYFYLLASKCNLTTFLPPIFKYFFKQGSRTLLEIYCLLECLVLEVRCLFLLQISQVIVRLPKFESCLRATFQRLHSFPVCLSCELNQIVMSSCSAMLTEACCSERMNCAAVPFLMERSWVHSRDNKPVFL